jgi:hypothetical protein
MKKKVGSIPMDQGQEPAARKLLQQGMLVGSWVLLQNCHLGLKMMRELETTIIQKRATEPEDLHDEFRCWISAEPHPPLRDRPAAHVDQGDQRGARGHPRRPQRHVRVAHPG